MLCHTKLNKEVIEFYDSYGTYHHERAYFCNNSKKNAGDVCNIIYFGGMNCFNLVLSMLIGNDYITIHPTFLEISDFKGNSVQIIEFNQFPNYKRIIEIYFKMKYLS